MKTNKQLLIVTFCILVVILNIGCTNTIPIKGKKIVVTAPKNYNTRLCELVNKTEAIAISMPVVDISLMNDKSEIDSVLNNISSFRWIVLPSRNAIRAFFKRAKETNIDKIQLNKTTYSAIGKDIEYLKTFSIDSILYPLEPSPKGIVELLKTKKPVSSNIAVFTPQVIGLPEPNVVPDFINNLKKAGMNVTRVNAYKTKLNNIDSYKNKIKSIKNGEIDLIAFTSSAEIEAMIYIMGGIKNLSKTPIACFGPYTAANAEKLGLKPCFIAKDYSSFQGYIASMKEYFNNKHDCHKNLP